MASSHSAFSSRRPGTSRAASDVSAGTLWVDISLLEKQFEPGPFNSLLLKSSIKLAIKE